MFRHLKAWIRRGRLDDELRVELAQHVAWKTESLIADGVPEAEARRRAAVEVGNVTRHREESRAVWGFPSFDSVIQDARYGMRQLRRTPLFTLATVTTLALTIGATSALFAIANAVVLRPLAFPRSDWIVSISIAQQGSDTSVMDEPTARLAMAGALPSFESLAIYNATGANFVGGAEPERVAGVRVSPRFFDVVGVQPALGRTFAPDEMRTGGPPAVIVSDSLARRAFGRSADALDRPVTLDDQRYMVIGIMPPGATFPARRDFWLPLVPRTLWSPGGGGFLYTKFIGRLRDGASPLAGHDDLLALRRSRESELPPRVRQSDIRVMPLHERLYGDFRAPVALLLGAVVSVLLIGCANVANLLLARAAVRRQELALRTALGASRVRLMRQLLVESLLLALLGAAPGLAFVFYALRAFLRFGPVELTRIPGIAMDARVLVFLLGVTIGVGLLFGVGPAIAAGRADPHEPLKGAGRSRDGRASRPRRVLVMLELAAAVVVMIGAALLAKRLVRFHAVDRGFRADSVLTASMSLPRPRYTDPAARRAFFDGVLERVRALPAVESAALPGALDSMSMTTAWPAGSTTGPPESESSPVGIAEVGSANFRTFGIPIRSGRECGDDGATDAQAAVVNERMARRAFSGRAAVGQQINLGSEGTFTVIGVSADVHDLRSNTMPLPKVFICAREASTYADIALRARAGIDPAALAPALREAVRAVDPAQPVADVTTLRQLVEESGASRRFDTLLFGGFAALAFVLAIFGLYAVTAYLVAQRTHEFGVRIALGAGRGEVLRLVLRQGLAPAVTGIVLGLAAALLLTRLLRTMLFEVGVLDAGVFAGVALTLALVSVGAALIPARRAVRVDPVVALRCD
jgi:putative ABC transport system permease protein